MKRTALLILAAAAVALAQDNAPEPGALPVTLVTLKKLRIAPQKGDAKAALAAFVDAHDKHKRGATDAALAGYLTFLGMPGRHELPARYTTTVERRVAAQTKAVHARYEKALDLYARDRARGLEELTLIAGRYPLLPEGAAALAFLHSDRLRVAIRAARAVKNAKGDTKAAAAALEGAIKRWASALYRYEAKTLLIDLGGPDLFKPGERDGSDGDEDPDADDGGGIEISDDG